MTSQQITLVHGANMPRLAYALIATALTRLSPVRAGRVMLQFALATLLALTISLPAVSDAAAAANLRKYAGIVVDAKSGKVLYEDNADDTRYPASVTKVMTLYILFQELSAGNIKLSDRMTVSKYAASAVPTKLGLKAGSKIKVEDAIKSLVTLSANDMARVIAEHISGSESKFAQRMTSTARALGMRKTTYRNASGLPNSEQVTTVRDQAVLGAAIYQHFPKYYAYFQTKSFSYGKRTYSNHNRLLGSNGVDGIKTGYINAAGYNLLTAVRTGNRHLVVVGFGFNKAGDRDAKVRSLVSKYTSKARSGGYLDVAMIPKPGRQGGTVQVATADEPAPFTKAAELVVPMPYPAFRVSEVVFASIDRSVVAPVPAAPAQRQLPVVVEEQAALRAVNRVGGDAISQRPEMLDAFASESFSPSMGAPPAPLGSTQPSAPLVPPVGIGENGREIDLMTSGSIDEARTTLASVETRAAAPAAKSDWVVQIGAAPTESGASGLLSSASASVGALGGFQPYVERFEKNGQVFYRARFAGFGDRDDASAMCSRLKKANMSCLALKG